MDKELKIIPPEGYEVDETNSTFACIKFKPIKPQLPKTWEEFCENTLVKNGESWIDEYGQINVNHIEGCKRYQRNKNILPSEDLVKAMLALCQLIQLRDCYNDSWQPDWTDSSVKKYCIYPNAGSITTGALKTANEALFFKTEELMNKFLKNFRDLIEVAKPLL